MGIRNILGVKDPALKKKSRVVTDFNKRLHVLLDDMRETMVEANGLGLAAPQVGVLRRVALIVDLEAVGEMQEGQEGHEEREEREEQIVELINPEIIAKSGEQESSEGCLSIPGVYGMVARPVLVKVRAQDRHGNTFELMRKNLTARVICHEVDHLNGIVFTSLTDHILTEEELEQMRAESAARDDENGDES